MSYTQGDTVVHPQHGAATVEGVVRRNVGGQPEDYLELKTLSPVLRILIPARSVGDVGVRDLSTKKEAIATLEVLTADSDVPEEWSERNPSTVTRMKSNNLEQRAMVIRDLTRHAQRMGKPLNAGENRALDECLDIVSKELSLALGIAEAETRALLVEKSLAQDVPEPAA